MRDKTPHEDLNPYAAPECVDSLPTDVFGAWRDGSMLVVHKQANLPRVCVVTGQPAAGARDQLLVWKSPGEFLSRQTHLMVPLCRKDLERYKFARRLIVSSWMLGGAALGTLVLRLLVLTNDSLTQSTLSGVASLAAVGGFAAWMGYLATNREPLTVAMGRGDYVWLAGAHRGFLQRLPPWTDDETPPPSR
jgi:hypothetical protein